MKEQGTQNRQNNLEKERSWESHTSQVKKLLKSYSNQNCDTGIRTDRSMEQK